MDKTTNPAPTQKEFREYFSTLSFEAWEESAPTDRSRLITSVQKLYKCDYQKFVQDFDWQAFDFPLDLGLFSNGDWQMIADWVSDVKSEMHDDHAERAIYGEPDQE